MKVNVTVHIMFVFVNEGHIDSNASIFPIRLASVFYLEVISAERGLDEIAVLKWI